jgi:DNA-binding beta-propeller fold protein YncE
MAVRTSLRASTGSAAPTAGADARGAGAAACRGTIAGEAPGTLTVINLRRAESDSAHSVAVTVDAGFQPVRVITSADGAQAWVTARAAGWPAVLGHIAAGRFPREMAVPPGGDGTLLVTNFQSSQLEAVDVASLPGA